MTATAWMVIGHAVRMYLACLIASHRVSYSLRTNRPAKLELGVEHGRTFQFPPLRVAIEKAVPGVWLVFAGEKQRRELPLAGICTSLGVNRLGYHPECLAALHRVGREDAKPRLEGQLLALVSWSSSLPQITADVLIRGTRPAYDQPRPWQSIAAGVMTIWPGSNLTFTCSPFSTGPSGTRRPPSRLRWCAGSCPRANRGHTGP